MAFESLERVFNQLEKQVNWQKHHQFRQVLQHWSGVVGAAVSSHTRPYSIQRGTLNIATANSVWAQNLSFERLRILQKLNQILSVPLTDIRFSAGYWRGETNGETNLDGKSDDNHRSWNHPSELPITLDSLTQASHPPQDANGAFQQWASRRRHQMKALPLCPQCEVPSPLGELDRWGVCCFCVTKKW